MKKVIEARLFANSEAHLGEVTICCCAPQTLVAFLLSDTTASDAPDACGEGDVHGGGFILAIIQEFALAVEKACPGKFDFFGLSSPASLHLTVRTLHRGS